MCAEFCALACPIEEVAWWRCRITMSVLKDPKVKIKQQVSATALKSKTNTSKRMSVEPACFEHQF